MMQTVGNSAFRTNAVMAGLVPAIHDFPAARQEVDAQDEPADDDVERFAP